MSAAEVLAGTVAPETFRDKVVLVGTSALATYDLKSTPLSANMTGVEKNATVVANILQGNFIVRVPRSVDVLVVLMVGLGAVVLLRRGRARTAFVVLGGMVVTLLVANQAAFSLAGLRLNLVYPLLALLTNGTYVIGERYLVEEQNARRIRTLFSRYVSPQVVDELIRHPEMARLGGVRREVTVLFSDLRDFTRFAENRPAEEVVVRLNEFLEAMTEVVFRWGGTVDKFVGDEIVAYWGAPLRQEDHAELAVRCALHMRKRIQALQQSWVQADKVPLEMGIGINSGEVLVGNIGAQSLKTDYTVIGDTVNLAARVEGLTRKYGVDLLITDVTLQAVRNQVASGRIGHVAIRGVEEAEVKGRVQRIAVYEVSALAEGEGSQVVACPPRRER